MRTPVPPGRIEGGDLPCRRREFLGMLRVDSTLDRVPAMHDRSHQHVLHAVSSRNQNLALHKVDVRDHLGDRMLHLYARIHFDEIETPVLVHQKLDRACVDVADVRQRLARISPICFRRSGLTCVDGDSSSNF